MWLAQSCTVIGFTFSFPFMPLFIQDMGISDGGQASLWAGIIQASMGIAMVLTSPIWGLASDRYGRKMNVQRAIVGSAIFLGLSAFATNVYQLIVLRFLTGLTSGVLGPSMALVASTTPRERIPFSLGVLQSAFFVGNTIGPLLGGLVADAWRLKGAFLVTAAIQVVAGLIVQLFAREDFHRSPESLSIFQREAYSNMLRTLTSRRLLPVLATIFSVQFFTIMSLAVLPVILDDLSPGSGGSVTGVAFAVMGITGGVASYSTGLLSKNVKLTRILSVAAVGAGLSFAPLFVADSVPQFYLLLATAGAFQGAMVAMTGGLVGLAVSGEHQGVAFGGLQAVQVTAFSSGPLLGGILAATVGLRWVFPVQAVGLLAVPVLVAWLLPSSGGGAQPAGEAVAEARAEGGGDPPG